MSPIPPESAFPDPGAVAKNFLEEAIRHLEDSRLLHENARYAASITSAMKAGELGLKTACILEGAMGWWPDVQKTHKVIESVTNNALLNRLGDYLDRYQSGLRVKALMLEKLVPETPKMSINELRSSYAPENTEYPFLRIRQDAQTQKYFSEMERPHVFFGQAESVGHYDTARDVLYAMIASYPLMATWNFTIPAKV